MARLAGESRDLDPLDAAHRLDDAFGVVAARGMEVVWPERSEHQTPTAQPFGVLGRASQQTQAGFRHLFIQVPRDVMWIDTDRQTETGNAVGLDTRVRVAKPSGVGQEPDIDRFGDVEFVTMEEKM